METRPYIPDELLLMIFSHLDETSEDKVSLVCPRWGDIIREIWSNKKRLTIYNYIEYPEIFAAYVAILAEKHPEVNEVTIAAMGRSDFCQLPSPLPAIEKFSQLTKIIFGVLVFKEEGPSIVSIVEAFPKLQSICIWVCAVRDSKRLDLALQSAPQIKELQIVKTQFIWKVVKPHSFCNLSHLVLEDIPFNNRDWIKLSEAGGRDNLENLAFTFLDYDKLCLISQNFPNLRHLYISAFPDNDFFRPDTFDRSNYMGFPLLENLCLSYGHSSNEGDLNFIISKCPQLKVIWIHNKYSKEKKTILAPFVTELMGQFKNIIHLILDNFNYNQLEPINFRHFDKLKKLTIMGPELTNEIIQRIIDCCPSLEHLDISDCVPPSPWKIKANYKDFKLSTYPLNERLWYLDIKPPFRAAYTSINVANDFWR